MQLPNKEPILIVGAGPTGLTLANVLTRYGLHVRIVEKKSRLSKHTKATNLMQRNQELLFALGLLDPLNAISGQMRRLMVHAYGKCFGPRTMRLKETPFTDVILCGQHNFEAVAANGLAEYGVNVEFDTELTMLSHDVTGCTATLSKRGITEEARFGYVIGCDGYAGITRAFTRHNFTPQKTGAAIRQVDCRLTWNRLSDMAQMWLFYFDHGSAVVVPLPGGVHRILTIEPKSAVPEREPTLEEMQAKLRQVTGDFKLTLSQPDWFSYTDLSMGLAPGLVDGRVILAGDVANPVLPNGGQGMNTGIADAFNLGWKLAAVLQHGAPTGLLRTYEEERLSLRRALQKVQFNSLKYTTLLTPRIVQKAFRLFMEPALNLGGEYKMAQAFSELTIHTRKSSLTLDSVGRKGLRAGDRALDAALTHNCRSIQLHDLLYRGSWTLLVFTGTTRRAVSEATQAALRFDKRVPTFLISTEPGTESPLPVLFDLDEEAHRVYGIKRAELLLVRPDGHMGARVRPADVALLEAYLDRWLPDGYMQFTRFTKTTRPAADVA